MKKKITIDELRPGMHVVSTNRSWLQIPFFKRKIRSMEIVEKLRAYHVTELVIDISKGRDVEEQAVDVFDDPDLIAANVSKSIEIHDQVLSETGKMMDDVREGASIEEQRADSQVKVLIDQIMSDPQSLLCVSVLKNMDEYTFNHCVNTAILALYVGRFMELNEQEMLDLGKGMLLHDIGKCMIPQEVLNKPGKLNAAEADIIKTHVERGVSYLRKVDILSPAVIAIAEQHHERMNGSGYPKGLKGDEIHKSARLAMVLDVYDAVTHENYYKNSEDPKCVLEFMEQGVGELYDEEAFNALKSCLGIYPPGTLLMLDTGEMAIAFEPNYENQGRPRILLMTHEDGSFCTQPEPASLSDTHPGTNTFKRNIVTAMTNEDAAFNPFEVLQQFNAPANLRG